MIGELKVSTVKTRFGTYTRYEVNGIDVDPPDSGDPSVG
jgi:hypothetical protein